VGEATWLKAGVDLCGAKARSHDGTCLQPAGWGTDHPGRGRCRFHGGNAPTHIARAKREALAEAAATYLARRDLPPAEALAEVLGLTAGAVAWLAWRVAEDEKPDADVVRLYGEERDRLARVSKAALDVGLDERRVALAEGQGRAVAMLLQQVLGDLELTREQRALAPEVVRRRLAELGPGRA
jgi:hypothetical protein